MTLWKNVSAISPIAWWNAYCGRKELNKIACKILTLSSTSAAVERSFSCYSNVHTAKRNRLSNERAAKVVFLSQNINLDSKSYACCERPVLDTASPGEDSLALTRTAFFSVASTNLTLFE